MQCLRCDGKQFTVLKRVFNVHVEGKIVDIGTECFVCDDCGDTIADSAQMCEMVRKHRLALKDPHVHV